MSPFLAFSFSIEPQISTIVVGLLASVIGPLIMRWQDSRNNARTAAQKSKSESDQAAVTHHTKTEALYLEATSALIGRLAAEAERLGKDIERRQANASALEDRCEQLRAEIRELQRALADARAQKPGEAGQQ